MVVFPNCKINLGLHVLGRRPDGFHDLETVFYPLNWSDALEILPGQDQPEPFRFSQSGLQVEGPAESNIVYRAWKLLSAKKPLPALMVHLHKNIPMGAGLGGGSADAAAFLKLANELFSAGLDEAAQMQIASALGSDCAFFIRNRPLLAKGKGDQFSEIDIDLSGWYILVVHPDIHSSTAEAYAEISPSKPRVNLSEVLSLPLTEWQNKLVNDFETPIFRKYPHVHQLRESMYGAGAVYASMSGSGSAVYGIFKKEPKMELPPEYRWYLQKPGK